MWDFLECFKSKGLFHRGNLFVCRKVTDLWNYKNNTTKSLTGLHALNWLRLLLWTSSLTHKEIRGLILCQVNNLFISKHIYLKRRSSRLITNLLNQRMAQCCSMSHLLPGKLWQLPAALPWAQSSWCSQSSGAKGLVLKEHSPELPAAASTSCK